MNKKVLSAVQRFKETHNKRGRNNDAMLKARVLDLKEVEFKEYVKLTEMWAKLN